MAIESPDKPVTKTLNLNDFGFENVAPENRAQVKREIGEFVVIEIQRALARGESPVENGIYNPTLTEDYAEAEKGGDRTADMQLEGDMLDSLKAESRAGDAIEIGIFNKGQTGKAFGHNTGFKGHPNRKMRGNKYRREFIPSDKKDFIDTINSGIRTIIRDGAFQTENFRTQPAPTQATPVQVELTLEDLLDNDIITRLFNGSES